MSATSPLGNPGELSADAVAAMRLAAAPSYRIDRIADRLNPIFIKETRQALKSKQFVIAFLLLLAAGWIVSVFAVMLNSEGLEYGQAGRELFAVYFVILSAAILVVVPFGAFRSLLTEREDATFEPLVITTLKPRQIVSGKLMSAMLQTFLFYSAIAPFIAFTALLQGFDFAYVSIILLIGLGMSLWVSMGALAISAMVKGRVWPSVVSMGVLILLIWTFGFLCSLAFQSYLFDWSDPGFWWAFVLWVISGATYVLLLQQIAIVNLTFEADNRSTGLRLICTGQFILLWGCLLVAIIEPSLGGTAMMTEFALTGMVMSLIHWSLCGLFFVTEPDGLSRRVLRQRPRRMFARLLLAPFYPGGHRGLLYIVIQIAITVVLGLVLVSDWNRYLPPLVGTALYITIYLSLAALAARWGMHWWSSFQPLHARVTTLLFVAFSMLLPVFLMLFLDSSYGSYHYWMLPNMFMTIEYLDRSSADMKTILTLLSIFAVLSIALNVPAMVRGLREIVQAVPEQ